MRALRDYYQREVNLGDKLLYTVKHSTSVDMNYAHVYGIIVNPRSGRYSLKVIAVSKTWNGGLKAYKTVLTANNFIVVDQVPYAVNEQMQKVRV